MQRRRGTKETSRQSRPIAIALVALAAFWAVSYSILIWNAWNGEAVGGGSGLRARRHVSLMQVDVGKPATKPDLHNLSRTGNVVATADVRGNLGPADVVVQAVPGKDWLHDRWQAASDMHGTEIKGAHWIHLDFGKDIIPEKIVLDWEAAYSDKYVVEASTGPITNETPQEEIWTLFDSRDSSQREHMSIQKEGQSPGVQSKTPLHVIHHIESLQSNKPCRYIRLHILNSAMGWGVSLWQFDLFGFYREEASS